MNKGRTVSIRFNNEEIENIEWFQQNYLKKGTDFSDAIRKIIAITIMVYPTYISVATNPEVNRVLDNFDRKYKTQAQSPNPSRKVLQEAYAEVNEVILPTFKKAMKKQLKKTKGIAKQRKVGAPKRALTKLKEKLKKGKITRKEYHKLKKDMQIK